MSEFTKSHRAVINMALSDLDHAALPTKSDVFVVCGSKARNLHDAVQALLADHARLVGEVEKVNATLADIDGGLELLRLAIAASDPKAELLVRVKDLAADLSHVTALTLPRQPQDGE